MLTAENFVSPLCLAAVVLFGLWAIFMYFRFSKSQAGKKVDTEFFLTARNTQPWYRVAWGLFATSVGAGSIFGPASFVLGGAGWIGMLVYSVFSGLPLIIIAHMGSFIKQRFPKPMSIASFGAWRFGRGMEVYITLLVLLNLGIALAAEYTAIGALFSTYLNTPAWIPILTVGIVTMAYTIAGG